MQSLIDARSTAHAEWQAATGKAKVAAAERLDAACKALAAAKRAAQIIPPAPTAAEVGAKVAAWNAAQAAKASDKTAHRAAYEAIMAKREADEYPRCGAGWPQSATERAHDAAITRAVARGWCLHGDTDQLMSWADCKTDAYGNMAIDNDD